MCRPAEVIIPMEKNAPPFLTTAWLKCVMKDVMAGYKAEDTRANRVSPMAFTRCSRGGKTRALCELGTILKKHFPQIAIIFVSFNDYSDATNEERSHPIEALCKRIAFASRKNQGGNVIEEYSKFKMAVSAVNIVEWLGDAPCILLIDELNNIVRPGMENGESFALFQEQFLKSCQTILCLHFSCDINQ